MRDSDVGDRERAEAAGERLGREAAAEQEPAGPEQPRREKPRVSDAYDSWTSPEPHRPERGEVGDCPRLTPNSSMILRKISGSRTACAWLTAWATESSHSERIGRISATSCIRVSCWYRRPIASVQSRAPARRGRHRVAVSAIVRR